MPRPPDRHRRAAPTAHSRNRTSTTITALALTCPWVRTALSPGRSRAPRQARSSPFHRSADSIIVTSDWLPERQPPHHRGQQPHRSAGAFRPCGWQARIFRSDCCMAARQRRNPLSCHRICSAPLTRGHKFRVISAQIEFLGGTGRERPDPGGPWRCPLAFGGPGAMGLGGVPHPDQRPDLEP